MTEPPKGFSLHVLRESLMKCRGDSAASRGRIKRLKLEIDDVNDRIIEQERNNEAMTNEVNKMRQNKANLNQQIVEKAALLDEITAKNTTYVKDSVIEPADAGVTAAKKAIETFEEMKDAGYKLQVMLRRENPEKEDKETNIDLPYMALAEEDDELFYEVLKAEETLFSLQKDLREVKDIARGSKPKKGSSFAPITRGEWETKLETIRKYNDEAAELQAELDRMEEEERKKSEEEALVLNGGGDANDTASQGEDVLQAALASAAMDTDEQDLGYIEPTSGRVIVQAVEQPDQIGGGDSVVTGAATMDDDDDDVPTYQPYYSSYNADD